MIEKLFNSLEWAIEIPARVLGAFKRELIKNNFQPDEAQQIILTLINRKNR